MTKIEKKIIQLLSDYPEQEFYGQEIANRLKCSKSSISGLLPPLLSKKMITKITKGRMGFYQINPANLAVKQFKIISALEIIKSISEKLKPFAKKAILFGLASRGEQTSGSDMDLLIISNKKEEALSAINKFKNKLNLQIIIKTPSEWSEMETLTPEFFQEIKNGITIF
jgi:predicted nucleotidyltransferase